MENLEYASLSAYQLVSKHPIPPERIDAWIWVHFLLFTSGYGNAVDDVFRSPTNAFEYGLWLCGLITCAENLKQPLFRLFRMGGSLN